MSMNPTKLLRNLLLMDAGTCVAMGMFLTLGARPLATLTDLPIPLLFYAGVALFPAAAFMVVTASRAVSLGWAVRSVIIGNLLWIAASLALVFGMWIVPNPAGYAFMGLQAIAVALLTVLEQMAWRRMKRGVDVSSTAHSLPSIIGSLAVVSLILGCASTEAASIEPEIQIEAEERAIVEFVERLAETVTARAYDVIRADLEDDWSYFTSGGREVDFEGWKKIVSHYTEIRFEVDAIRPHLSTDGRLAWATFGSRLQGTITSEVVDMRLRFTAIFRKTGDRWKLRHLQSTRSSDPL
jgi:ketosteroid isomerase-like protein